MFLGSSPHQVGGFQESFLPDLEEDLSPDRVEWNVRELRNSLFGSFRPLHLESEQQTLRGFGPQPLLVFALLRYQGLGDKHIGWLFVVIEGRSMSDQKKQEGLIPIMNAWITSDKCASGMALISFVKWARSSIGWVTGGCPSGDSVAPTWVREATWGWSLIKHLECGKESARRGPSCMRRISSAGFGARGRYEMSTGLGGVLVIQGFFSHSVRQPFPESPPRVAFIPIRRWPVVHFPSIFAASSADVFNERYRHRWRSSMLWASIWRVFLALLSYDLFIFFEI
ncbi:hypothetical protein BHE74_00027956 [Ensete ventricosum]|nr:hypothetical protein BHE74_00027956 [Ensete ventricosum]